MASTFTGLKLQGQLGKFGRIEISDISAYVELPDGKVLSGTEWGNFLLWDGGFIKVELSKKGKKFCHNVRRGLSFGLWSSVITVPQNITFCPGWG